VYSVLEQEFTAADFEVIVVNDSGQPLAEADWQRSDRVQVINTNRRERSVARNTGAAMAKGKYLHFLDDDDWLLPGALGNFWILAGTNGEAVWLYGGAQFVDSKGELLMMNPQFPKANSAILNLGLDGNCFIQVLAGAWIPLQASLIKPEIFFSLGGFRTSLSSTQDLDLCSRIALLGDFANTSAIVANILRGTSWRSVTNYNDGPEHVRWWRNRILSEPGAFARMRSSADSSYWHGRILHAYLSTVIYNLRRRDLFTAAGRATFGLASLVLAGWHVFSPSFWQAIKTHNVTHTLLQQLQASDSIGVQCTHQQ
jgi:glycosyltransferase involved in cell wall biosynthesis